MIKLCWHKWHNFGHGGLLLNVTSRQCVKCFKLEELVITFDGGTAKYYAYMDRMIDEPS